MGKGENERELLLVALGELADATRRIELEPLEQLIGQHALAAPEARHVLEVPAAGLLLVESHLTGDVADPVTQACAVESHRLAKQRPAPRCGLQQTEQTPDGRGLSRAVRAEETVDRSLRHTHREIGHTLGLAVVLGQ